MCYYIASNDVSYILCNIGCCQSTCSYNNNITSNGVSASGPLNVTWSAFNNKKAALMVDWRRPSSGSLNTIAPLAIATL